MRPATLASLGLGERLDNVVGTALLARAAAIQVRRSEGPSARMQHLAALSIGTMALLDVEVTARAAAGLALTLYDLPTALQAIAAGIAAASGSQQGIPRPFFAEPGIFPAVPADWAVFSFLQEAISDVRLPRFYPGEIAAAIGRDEGQPIGRLGISAYRWLRLAEVPAGAERVAAARWILERGADEVDPAIRDTSRWQTLHAGLAPVEPELLLAALIFVRASQHGQIGVDVRSVDRPVIRAALAVAAGMLGFLDLAEALGGPADEIEGQAGIRWQHWLDNVGGGPMQW